MLYDPIIIRNNAFTPGRMTFYLGTQYDSNRPMGNVAVSELGTVVRAWLVGLDKEIAPLLPRTLSWIDKAFERDERCGDFNGYQTILHSGKALGTWLLDASNDEGEWEKARVFEEARWRDEQNPWPTNKVVKWGLDDYMAYACQAGAYDNDVFEAGIDMYERWTGKSGPVNLSKALKPRDLGYALCQHWSAKYSYDEDALFKAGCKVLEANLQNDWLGTGQYLQAATWLKIVYWHRYPDLTPLQTILKAYDHMPKVTRPEFVPNT